MHSSPRSFKKMALDALTITIATPSMEAEVASDGAAAREAGAAVQANTLSQKTKQIYCCALKALQEYDLMTPRRGTWAWKERGEEVYGENSTYWTDASSANKPHDRGSSGGGFARRARSARRQVRRGCGGACGEEDDKMCISWFWGPRGPQN